MRKLVSRDSENDVVRLVQSGHLLKLLISVFFFICAKVFVLIFGSKLSSGQSQTKVCLWSLIRRHSPSGGGTLVKIHDCDQTTGQCKATATGPLTTETNASKLHIYELYYYCGLS